MGLCHALLVGGDKDGGTGGGATCVKGSTLVSPSAVFLSLVDQLLTFPKSWAVSIDVRFGFCEKTIFNITRC